MQSTSKGLVGIAVTDCAGNPITDTANITLSITQNNTAVTGDTVVDASTYSSAAAGAFLALNVPAASGTNGTTTEVGATYLGMTFRAHSMIVVQGGTSSTIVKPGY